MSNEKAVDAEQMNEVEEPVEQTLLDVETTDETHTEPAEMDVGQLQIELEQAQTKAAEHQDGLLRVRAEMDNLRKRSERDVQNAHKYAVERFAQDLLPVIDSLELGLNAAESATDAGSLKEGMTMTLNMFTDALGKHGLEIIHPEGEKFSPELHQAMTMQESDEVEAGTVLAVMQKGYSLNERLIRPAMVIVAKKAVETS